MVQVEEDAVPKLSKGSVVQVVEGSVPKLAAVVQVDIGVGDVSRGYGLAKKCRVSKNFIMGYEFQWCMHACMHACRPVVRIWGPHDKPDQWGPLLPPSTPGENFTFIFIFLGSIRKYHYCVLLLQ